MQHYRILIASPSDVTAERKALKDAFARWNKSHARPGVHLEPVMWETDSVPDSGSDPQSFINRDLGDCHAAIALLWTRIGTATPRALSGTIEEIESFLTAGKSVMLYVSVKLANPQRLDAAQLGAVHKFVKGLEGRALYSSFKTPHQLENDLGSHLNTLADRLVSAHREKVTKAPPPIPPEDMPRLFDDQATSSREWMVAAMIKAQQGPQVESDLATDPRVLAHVQAVQEEARVASEWTSSPDLQAFMGAIDAAKDRASEAAVVAPRSTIASRVAKMEEEEATALSAHDLLPVGRHSLPQVEVVMNWLRLHSNVTNFPLAAFGEQTRIEHGGERTYLRVAAQKLGIVVTFNGDTFSVPGRRGALGHDANIVIKTHFGN